MYKSIKTLSTKFTYMFITIFCLFGVANSYAAVYVSGVTISVDGSDNVTFSSSGSSQFVNASVGAGGVSALTGGWGISAGSIQWLDTNSTPTLLLNSSGVNVQNAGGFANSNGSKSGSVTFTGTTTLGASLRATYGVGGPTAFTETISGNAIFEVSGTVTVAAVPVPGADLSITKTDGVTSATPGSTVTYTIVASNAGTLADPSATVSDTFPAGLTCTYTSVAAGGATGNTAAGAGNLSETLNMPVGSSVTYTAICTIPSNATGTLSNTATIASSITDPDTGNNSATDADTVLVPQADVSITKTDGVTSAIPGGSLTYTIVASNGGPSDDPSVTVADTFPADLTCTYTSVAAGGATGNTAAGAGNLAETLSMPSGSSVTYTASCDIDSAATGTLSNTATATASVTDLVAGNNSATDGDTVLEPQADVSITVDDGVTSAVPDFDTIVYTIVASNAGPSDDPAVSVADMFPAGLTCDYTSVAAGGAAGNTAAGMGDIADTLVMPAGSSVTYTAMCTFDDPAARGTLSNTATIAGSVTDPDTGNDTAVDNDTVLRPLAAIPTLSNIGIGLLLLLLLGYSQRRSFGINS